MRVHTFSVNVAPNNMVTNPGHVLDTTATDKDHRVLLQIMALTGNVCRNLSAVRQPHTRYLPQSGIRLSWRKRAHRDADTALLRRPVCANRAILKGVKIPVQIRRLALKRLGFPSSPHKLIGCWHCSNLPIHEFQNHFTRKDVLYHLRMTLSTERAGELGRVR